MAQVAIAIEGVSVRFGETQALGGVSLEIEPGELLLLLGPSGCGKSTLLRSVAGFVTPDSGCVRFDAEDITKRPPHERQIGMVFQSFALFPHLSVGENVAFGLRERKTPKGEIRGRVEQALSDVHMGDFASRRVEQLSGGEQQRVALARALVTRPRCLLLDEPLSNLDAGLRQDMREEIRRVCKEYGLTTLYVTHDQKEALAIADRIAVLRHGRLEQVGTPLQIYRQPASRSVATFLGETNLLEAVVTESHERGISLRSGGLELESEASFAKRGDEVLVSVRPECLRLSREQPSGPRFLARVERVGFLGELCDIELSHQGQRLRAFELNSRLEERKLGSELWVSVAAEDVVLLAPGQRP